MCQTYHQGKQLSLLSASLCVLCDTALCWSSCQTQCNDYPVILRRRERWTRFVGIVMLHMYEHSYYLHTDCTHYHKYIHTLWCWVLTLQGGKKVVWRCAPIPANKIHHIHTLPNNGHHTYTYIYQLPQHCMAQSTSLHNEMHMFTTYIEHVLLMCYLDRTISYVRDHIIQPCLWVDQRTRWYGTLILVPISEKGKSQRHCTTEGSRID